MTETLKPITGRKEYPAIDIIKFLLSLFVISFHVEPFASFESESINTFCFYSNDVMTRFCVPFYFAAAGFFLAQKLDFQAYNPEISKRYILKSLHLLATWVIILSCEEQVHLWYMGALVVAVLFLDILLKRNVSLKKMIIIAIPLYVFGLLGTTYYGSFALVKNTAAFRYLNMLYIVLFKTTRNGIFMGYPFVLIGLVVAKQKIHIGRTASLAGVIVSFVLLYLEGTFIRNRSWAIDFSMYFSLIPLVFFLLTAATQSKLKPKPFYRNLRNAGVIIYFSHFVVNKLVKFGFSAIGSFTGMAMPNSMIIFLATVIAAVLLGLLISVLSQKPKFSFLKCLY